MEGLESVYKMGYEGGKNKNLELFINGLILQTGMALANIEYFGFQGHVNECLNGTAVLERLCWIRHVLGLQ